MRIRQTINDASLSVSMAQVIVDYPANSHNGAAGVSFADGHTEMHRWMDAFAKNLTLTGATDGPGRSTTGSFSKLPGFGLATASDFSAQVMRFPG